MHGDICTCLTTYKIDARVTCPMATINNHQASNIDTILA